MIAHMADQRSTIIISDQRLEKAMRMAVRIYDLDGTDRYWPILERLKSELEARADKESFLSGFRQSEKDKPYLRAVS